METSISNLNFPSSSKLNMKTIINNLSNFLDNGIHNNEFMVQDVDNEIETLLQHIRSVQSLLDDAEERKYDEPNIKLWLLELKDVMHDANYTIYTRMTENIKYKSRKKKKICRCATIRLSHDVRNRINELSERFNQIYKDGKEYELQESKKSKPLQITGAGLRKTYPLVDPLVVGSEVDVAANELVNHLITEKVEEKCHVFVITGKEGVGKTTLAQKIFNHHEIQNYFNVKVWACVTQTYSTMELLKLIIIEAQGSYRNDNTDSELQSILRDSVASCQSFFLVLDEVMTTNVWIDCLQIPLENANVNVRVLVTTRYENVAKDMKAKHTHLVKKLSIETSWDMLCRLLFSHGQEELAYELKELGFQILEKCDGHPVKILFVARALRKKEFTRNAWQNVLGSISNLLRQCAIR